MSQQPIHYQQRVWFRHKKQEGKRQRHHEQQLELTFPGLLAEALESQIAFVIPDGHFHLPALRCLRGHPTP
jgi:hypothetical protein